MTQATIVQYRTKPEQSDENERLIRAVFTELAASDPGDLRYAAFRLADGATFVHVAVVGDENPLNATAAFRDFQSGLMDRCDVPPAPAKATLVGSYGVDGG
jgi:hypothetical protein